MFNGKYIKFLENEIAELKEEVKTLKKENFNLQAAIVAQKAPMAYEHFAKKTPENKASERMEKENQFLRRYAQEIEQPLFSSVDEMIDLLGSRAGVPNPPAIHTNSES